MSFRKSAVVPVLVLLGGTALACGPFFPSQLLDDRDVTLKAAPTNSFAFEMAHLAAPPKDQLKAAEPNEYDQESDRQAALTKADGAGLSDDQGALLAQIRGDADGEAVEHDGAALPVAIRLYTAAAVDFNKGDSAKAAKRFQAVLNLPASDGAARAVWAAFMLGRIAAVADDQPGAAAAFARTRQLALSGAPDPLGLAVASWGEEARPHFDAAAALIDKNGLAEENGKAATYASELGKAVSLYAEQAARGSWIAVDSLRMVAEQIEGTPGALDATIEDPLIQRLLVDHALSEVSDDSDSADSDETTQNPATTAKPDPTPSPALVALVAAIEAHGIDKVPDSDRLASLAYSIGRYDLAQSLAKRAPGPLASWVEAKLALRRGDMDAAAHDYAAAVQALPAAPETLDPENTKLLPGQSGVLGLGRGDFVGALDAFYPVADTYWGDTAYIAERVVTTDELKRFVDQKVPAPPPKPPAPAKAAPKENDSTGAGTDADTPPPDDTPDPASQLRDLLARRLVRDGRITEALPYFNDPANRKLAADYQTALSAATGSWWRISRAQAWHDAAQIARDSGMEIMGTEVAPDYNSTSGTFDFGYGPDKKPAGPFVTPDESKRYDATAPQPDHRFHYRYIAADEEEKAADLLPPRSQAFAAVLCSATGWMYESEHNGVDPEQAAIDRANALYARYVKEGAVVPWATHFGNKCPDPDFDAAGKFWWVHAPRDARHWASRNRWGLGAALLLAIGAAGTALILWRRRKPA